jgi:pimeloyl-ACP methyl ester carboxylesterase
MSSRLVALGLVAVFGAAFLAAAPAIRPRARIVSSPCRNFDGGAAKDHRRCFRVDVPEDPARPGGRRIQLDGFVIAATAPNPAKAALFVLDGGPGQRATDDMTGEGDWSEVLTDHDIVVIDQRGTGTPPNLRCNSPVDDAHLKALLNDEWPVAEMKRCLAAAEGHADPRLYTTANSAEDIELARRALGYGRIDLIGGSYGTRLAQVYVRRYGDHVRSLVLDGPVAPDSNIPEGMSRRTDATFEAVFDRCLAQAACATAFPDIKAEFERVKARLWREGLWVTDASGEHLWISPGIVASALRMEAYNADSAARLPMQVHALTHGDDKEVAEMVFRWRKGMATTPSNGVYLSITCAEDFPRNDLDALRRSEEGTLLSHFRTDQLTAACGAWPRGVDQLEHRLAHWTGPVLVLSGALDPATPPEGADRVIGQYPNGRLVRLANQMHGPTDEAWACEQPMIVAFIRSGKADGLDTRCAAGLAFPRFPIEPTR